MISMEERAYEIDPKKKQELNDLLAADPYAPMSFARVAPQIKEIEDKLFLYIKADIEFFKVAEEKLKTVNGNRAKKEDEEKIVNKIHDEEEAAAGGFGGIFG